MSELPDNVEDTVLHVETGAAGLPFGNVEISHLGTGWKCGSGTDLLVNRTQNAIIDLQAKGVYAGLFLKERRRR